MPFFLNSLFLILYAFGSSAGVNETRVQELLNTNTNLTDGPNCWNAVMYSLGFIDEIRYVSPQEFNFFVSNRCDEISKKSLEYGDVARLHSGGYFEDQHAYVYIGEDQLFEKPSPKKEDLYSYRSLNQLVIKFEEDIKEIGPKCDPTKDIYCKEVMPKISYYNCSLSSVEIDSTTYQKFTKLHQLMSIFGEDHSSVRELQKNLILELSDDEAKQYLNFLADPNYAIFLNQLSSQHLEKLLHFSKNSPESLRSVLRILSFTHSEQTFEDPIYKKFIGDILKQVKKESLYVFWALIYQSNLFIFEPSLRDQLLLSVKDIIFKKEHQTLKKAFVNNMCSDENKIKKTNTQNFELNEIQNRLLEQCS